MSKRQEQKRQIEWSALDHRSSRRVQKRQTERRFLLGDTKTSSAMSAGAAASKNISNFAPLKHCADRKNFKIFASGKIKFATHGERKFTMRSMAKFAARRGLKFEPCDTAARDFAMRDKILSSRLRKNCVSSKISSRRGEKKK